MNQTQSERRMAQNEVVFRRFNEKVQKGFQDIKQMAVETNQEHLIQIDDTPLHFYCECSDENCRKRVMLKPSAYRKIHRNRRRFVLICGHETVQIEKVVGRFDNYCVVEKSVAVPSTATTLQATSVDNS